MTTLSFFTNLILRHFSETALVEQREEDTRFCIPSPCFARQLPHFVHCSTDEEPNHLKMQFRFEASPFGREDLPYLEEWRQGFIGYWSRNDGPGSFSIETTPSGSFLEWTLPLELHPEENVVMKHLLVFFNIADSIAVLLAAARKGRRPDEYRLLELAFGLAAEGTA